MFGMGWSEMMVVGIVALIVVGPKDLPGLFRTIGEFTGKAKGMAREFNRAMNNAAKETGVPDVSKTIKAAADPKSFGVDKLKEAADLGLSEERAANKAKIDEAMATAARNRQTKEAAEAAKSEASE